jgi:long-chain acyl-CoA synthetase
MDMLGIFSKNREVNIKKKNFKEWLMVEYADFLYNFTSVPLYDTLGEDAFKFVLD